MIKKISKAGMAIALAISLLALNTNSVNAKVDNRTENEKLIWNNMAKVTAPELMAGPTANTIKSIEVITNKPTIERGEKIQLVVEATMADGSKMDITNDPNTKYESVNTRYATVSSSGEITINPTSPFGGIDINIKNGNGATKFSTTIIENPATVVKSIEIITKKAKVERGEKIQLQVIGTMEDGSQKDVTDDPNTKYESVNTNYARVSSSGEVTIVPTSPLGMIDIKVKNRNSEAKFSTTIIENPATVVKSIEVLTKKATIERGEKIQLQVMGTMEDGSVKDITSDPNTIYETESVRFATVNSTGEVTINPTSITGKIFIKVKNKNSEAKFVTTIIENPSTVVKSIEILTTKGTVERGEKIQLQVMGTMEDGSVKDITSDPNTIYEPESVRFATVNSTGEVTINPSSVTGKIFIKVKNKNNEAKFVTTIIENPSTVVKSIEILTKKATVERGEKIQLQVMGTMADGSVKDITSDPNTRYESESTRCVRISDTGEMIVDPNSSFGRISMKVTNNYQQAIFTTTIIQNPSTVVKSIEILTKKVTVERGEKIQLQVIATMQDGSTKDITRDPNTRYESESTRCVRISDTGEMVVDPNSPLGRISMKVTNNYQQAIFTTTIKEKTYDIVKGVEIRTGKSTINKGETVNLKIVAVMDDGSEKDITELPKEWEFNDAEIIELNRETISVKGLKKGVANIKVWVKGYGDFPAECQVTVVDNKEQNSVLNIEPEKDKIKLNEVVTANLVMDNIENIAAEDVVIKYDSEKLKFVDMKEVDGIKLVKNDIKAGELRFILASKGKNNIVNAKKTLLKLNFQGIKRGEALVDIVKGRVSDGIESEYSLEEKQCGQATIIIDDMADVNNSGEFTLLDLAIDARHLGEDPTALKQYNTDIEVNGAIDDADLLEIANQMLLNPNYKL